MEQSTGINQINKALTQMEEVTQQNSALVEERAATAKTLEQQSATMTAEVNVFRIDDDQASLVPRAPKAAGPAQPAARPQRAPKSEAPAKAPRPAASAGRAFVGEMQGALAAAYQEPKLQDF
jgi:uncharacterized phage infection (PIP) family protein YhgE